MTSPKKSSQEQAAEIIAAYPFFSDVIMPKREATRLKSEAQKIKEEVKELRPYLLPDKELVSKLRIIKQQAIASGVWEPLKGENSKERLGYATMRNVDFGYTKTEASSLARKELAKDGYLAAIRDDHKEKDQRFKNPINDILKKHKLPEHDEGDVIKVIDLVRIAKPRLGKDFPSGNFLYHGTETEQLIKILQSGNLSNAGALYEQEAKTAKAEGRDTELIRRNSGYEGISWSLNAIDALPGDRYHLAGLLASPELVLGKDEQLVIPSRPAINEVLQLALSIDARKFYEAKTQLELYCHVGTFGEANSVFNNLWAVSYYRKNPKRSLVDKPLLYIAGRKLAKHKGYVETLREHYTIGTNGLIYLSHNLLGQVDDEIPIAAVWLQAAIDSGRLQDTVFADKVLSEIIETMNSKNTDILLRESKKDWEPFEKTMNAAEAKAKHVQASVDKMYLVAARKDLGHWLKVLVRVQHKPLGILLYDDSKVRLENFATSHRGDHAELTRELRSAIPQSKGYIDYNAVLGVQFTDDMRAGHHHQIIAESHLENRGIIKWNNGKLIVER